MSETASRPAWPVRRFRLWTRRVSRNRKIAFALAALAVISGTMTFATMTEASEDPKTVLLLLYVDAVLLLLLGAVVARRLVAMWVERRKGLAGSRLHIRLVVLFSLVAVTPAILVAVFAGLFLNFGVQAWFSERVSTALSASREVARSYLHEHQQTIRADVLAMANDLNRQAPVLARSRRAFDQVVSTQAALRSLPEAIVIDASGQLLARSPFSFSLEADTIPQAVFETARLGDVAMLTNDDDDRVRAIVRLDRFVDAYLVIGRFVSPNVLEHIQRTEAAVDQYKSLEKRRKGTQITFVMIFMIVALLLLLAAVWIGMTLATQLVRPISGLITAAEGVRKGNLGIRVDAGEATDEIATLSRAFNRMTSQIETQQEGLLEANRQLDERRRFTETVLAGVSAGVIGLDNHGKVHLPNRSACELLRADLENCVDTPLGDVVPEMADLLSEARARPDRMQQAEVRLTRGGRHLTLLVRIAAEKIEDEVIGYVVTFDDITDLQTAQRTAAWADVARRIAHEIKNPLTPIQLSAERLKRKFLKQIDTDSDTFATCTETIVRQVEDIGRMVDEFSAFARMPESDMKLENLSELCRQAVFLERNRHQDVAYDMELPDADVRLRCDSRQIGQVLTNLLKNAAESISGRDAPVDGRALPPGSIRLVLVVDEDGGNDRILLAIEDNGRGFPEDDRDRLTEPYVTTRSKGTGLGLAIVKKIVEDHDADLLLEDREGGGARVSMTFLAEREHEIQRDGPKDPMEVATGLLHDGA